ncbi:MAG TPA: hypothetical protein PLD59_03905 [Tepidisphaeraceae bacterium]|nr:hypothetical protein [Tepidisphaeraceae bacterium]
MPSLIDAIELFDGNPIADAWHRVTAPGGYEWWYFDAEDREHDRQFVVILLEGFVFHPGYLRALKKFRSRPTRRLPPLPGDFPCAYFVVYEQGRIAHQFMLQYPRGELRASCDRLDVALGPNTIVAQPDGSIRICVRGVPWQLTWQGPKRLEGQTLTGEFVFRPRLQHAAVERTFLSRAMTGAEHRWVLANPLCEVTGSYRVFTADAPGAAVGVNFSGLGYHDHNYGTGPLGPGLRRWIWGRAVFDDCVFTFHYAKPRDRTLADETHLVRGDGAGLAELQVRRVDCDWGAVSPMLLRYPKQLVFNATMRLHSPRLIDSAPFYMRLMYQAECQGRRGSAFCEVAYPSRLRWPILGRMIEMSISKV